MHFAFCVNRNELALKDLQISEAECDRIHVDKTLTVISISRYCCI